jgi:hypothetical protein
MVSNTTLETGFFHLHLKHQDVVRTDLRVTNGALNQIQETTTGFLVDLTPPELIFIGDGAVLEKDMDYQVSITN